MKLRWLIKKNEMVLQYAEESSFPDMPDGDWQDVEIVKEEVK